jgi:hypothetical protein
MPLYAPQLNRLLPDQEPISLYPSDEREHEEVAIKLTYCSN